MLVMMFRLLLDERQLAARWPVGDCYDGPFR